MKFPPASVSSDAIAWRRTASVLEARNGKIAAEVAS